MTYSAGVIGCGNAGTVHAEVLDANPDTELVGVCDPVERNRKKLSDRFSVPGFEDVDQLLDEQNPDGVHICSPVQTHASIATDTIESGFPTLIEKPLATTVSEAEDIIEASDNQGVTASTVHNRLYSDRLIEARRRVARGEIGDLIAVDFISSTQADLSEATRGDWVFDLPGGELGETLPHHAYLTLAFTDRLGNINGTSVQNSRKYKEVDLDGFSMTATDSSGDVLLTLRALTNSSERYDLTAYGTEGIMRIDLRHTPGIYVTRTEGFSPKVVIKNFLSDGAQLSKNLLDLVVEQVKDMRSDEDEAIKTNLGHYRVIDKFSNAVVSNASVPVTLDEGLDTIRILEALEEAE